MMMMMIDTIQIRGPTMVVVSSSSPSVWGPKSNNWPLMLCRSCGLVKAVSFANDAPQFSDVQRDPVQKLSLSSAAAMSIACQCFSWLGCLWSYGQAGKSLSRERNPCDRNPQVLAHYEIFTAAGEGTTKSLGCQLMAHAVSSVVAHSPRELNADLRLCSCDDTTRCNVGLSLCSAQSKRSGKERVAFCELLGKVLRAKPCGWRSILLGDFNGRVGRDWHRRYRTLWCTARRTVPARFHR